MHNYYHSDFLYCFFVLLCVLNCSSLKCGNENASEQQGRGTIPQMNKSNHILIELRQEDFFLPISFQIYSFSFDAFGKHQKF